MHSFTQRKANRRLRASTGRSRIALMERNEDAIIYAALREFLVREAELYEVVSRGENYLAQKLRGSGALANRMCLDALKSVCSETADSEPLFLLMKEVAKAGDDAGLRVLTIYLAAALRRGLS